MVNSSEFLTKNNQQTFCPGVGPETKEQIEEPVKDVLASAARITSSLKDTHLGENMMLHMTGLSQDDKLDIGRLIEFTTSNGFLFGERFSMIEALWANSDVALTRLRICSDLQTESTSYILHPTIIDACIQMKFCLDLRKSLSNSSTKNAVPSLPVGKVLAVFWYVVPNGF